MTMRRHAVIMMAGTLAAAGTLALGADDVVDGRTEGDAPLLRSIRIPATAVTLELVPVTMPTEDDAPSTTLWFLRTEITWDIYDVFVYRLDLPAGDRESDAQGRPSKPYVPPDRGFGHHGFAAMGMTFDAAQAFCVWLSERTGARFRLPTEAEWMHACLAGADGDFSCGDPGEPVDANQTSIAAPACLKEIAWFADNADGQTRAVATRAANAFGLHDMHGNVAEWVVTGERRPIAKGGSYRDPAEQLAASARMRQTSAWNASDPQIPKSAWWLADVSWVGFRVVMEE